MLQVWLGLERNWKQMTNLLNANSVQRNMQTLERCTDIKQHILMQDTSNVSFVERNSKLTQLLEDTKLRTLKRLFTAVHVQCFSRECPS